MSEHADQFEEREDDVSQYEQENDLGSGGGEVDDETLDEARERSGGGEPDPDADEPWAKTSSGDADEI
jgi:hypothetical protein